jgi:hypothetical protein
MTAPPTNHHLHITLPDGKSARATVVYVQPNDERWREERAEVHIVSADWLDSYTYPAVYTTPTQSVSGTLFVYGYADHNDQWLFKGTFTRAQDDSAHAP